MQTQHLNPIREAILKGVHNAGFEVSLLDLHLERTKTLEHGHFATNVAMLLAGKSGMNPREVAAKIIAELTASPIEKAETAGPGFINLWIEQKFYTDKCHALLRGVPSYLQEAMGSWSNPKTVVIEHSSPNIAKPLGVHNLLSTIIGDSLQRIYKACGHHVITENYPGDMGTQFGKLIYAIRTWGDFDVIHQNPIDELLKLYVHFHETAEKDPSLEDKGRLEYKKFEEGDPKNRALWQRIVDWTLQEIQPLYDRLGVVFDAVHGESFFEDRMPAILEQGRKDGIFVDGEEGAWIVRPEDSNDPPALIKKSDGTTLYLTRDLAQIAFFEEAYHPDLMVWPVDVAQSLHFKQRFEVSNKLKQTNATLVHVVFGRMQFKDGGMSTRKGKIIKMADLLDEAEMRALKLVQEKAHETSPEEQSVLSRLMGIGAIKYNVLSQNRTQDITFDWDKMLAFEGNSAPYLMYTVARARSVLSKSSSDHWDWESTAFAPTHEHEIKVMLDLIIYPEALERAAEEFKPNHVAHFLYGLAQNFNTLYNALPMLKAATETERDTRLLLAAATEAVVAHGMALLGIEAPETM